MTQRITKHMLELQIIRINELANTPNEPYSKIDGKFKANPGNYHLDWAYGGVQLVKMSNEGGGISCPIGQGYDTKRELFGKLTSFIAGIAL